MALFFCKFEVEVDAGFGGFRIALHSLQVCQVVLPQPARTACLWITYCIATVASLFWPQVEC